MDPSERGFRRWRFSPQADYSLRSLGLYLGGRGCICGGFLACGAGPGSRVVRGARADPARGVGPPGRLEQVASKPPLLLVLEEGRVPAPRAKGTLSCHSRALASRVPQPLGPGWLSDGLWLGLRAQPCAVSGRFSRLHSELRSSVCFQSHVSYPQFI